MQEDSLCSSVCVHKCSSVCVHKKGSLSSSGCVHPCALSGVVVVTVLSQAGGPGAGRELLVSCSDDFTLFLWHPAKDKKPLVRMTG